MSRFIYTRSAAILVGGMAALWLAAVAQAHVNVHPNHLPANRFMSILVRVPNERDNANTVKVDFLVPPGINYVYSSPVPGWKITRPSDQRVVWTALPGGGIKPVQFIDFPVAFATGASPGTVLAFKALQYYSNGEVVRWIGDANSDHPASFVTIVGHDDALSEYPAGITGITKMKVIGGAIALAPILLLAGYALGRRRRRSPDSI